MKVVLLLLSDPDDPVVYKVLFISSSGLGAVLILRSMKSEINPGFVIFLSSQFISPVSIFTTVDMDGRSFGLSCVHKRPIFKNLHASSASNSPFKNVSTNTTNSLFSYRFHVCNERNEHYQNRFSQIKFGTTLNPTATQKQKFMDSSYGFIYYMYASVEVSKKRTKVQFQLHNIS